MTNKLKSPPTKELAKGFKNFISAIDDETALLALSEINAWFNVAQRFLTLNPRLGVSVAKIQAATGEASFTKDGKKIQSSKMLKVIRLAASATTPINERLSAMYAAIRMHQNYVPASMLGELSINAAIEKRELTKAKEQKRHAPSKAKRTAKTTTTPVPVSVPSSSAPNTVAAPTTTTVRASTAKTRLTNQAILTFIKDIPARPGTDKNTFANRLKAESGTITRGDFLTWSQTAGTKPANGPWYLNLFIKEGFVRADEPVPTRS